MPEHIRPTDIPITTRAPFFKELAKSVSNTISSLLKAVQGKEISKVPERANENGGNLEEHKEPAPPTNHRRMKAKFRLKSKEEEKPKQKQQKQLEGQTLLEER